MPNEPTGSWDEPPEYFRRSYERPPTPSADEELALIAAYQKGDAEALRQLITANERLIYDLAKAFEQQRRDTPRSFDDLIAAGNEGVALAAQKFNADKGFRFSIYAMHWIRQSMGKALQDGS